LPGLDGGGGLASTQTVWSLAFGAGTTALDVLYLNAYVKISAQPGVTITLPTAQPDGTYVVLRITVNPVTYGAATLAVDTTYTFLIFSGGTWQTM
jgi:hypothetical protein